MLGMDCEGCGVIVGLGVVLRVLSRWRWSMAEVVVVYTLGKTRDGEDGGVCLTRSGGR